MKFLTLSFIILALSACGGSDPIKQPTKTENETVKQPEKKTNQSDQELLNLLEPKKDGETKQVTKDGEVKEDVKFQPIGGNQQTDNTNTQNQADTTQQSNNTNQPTDQTLVLQNQRNTNLQGNAQNDAEIQRLKQELKNKEQSLQIAQTQNRQLQSEITNLRSNPVKTPVNVMVSEAEQLSEADYKARYDQAYQLFTGRDYDGSRKLFQTLVNADPSNSLADNAQYWIGECNFAQRNFKQAVLDFEKVFAYKKTNKKEDAQFKIGYCYFLLKDRVNAEVELKRFIADYPNSRNRARAEKMLTQI